MIASYLVNFGQFIESPIVKLVAVILAGWAGYRFCGWYTRT